MFISDVSVWSCARVFAEVVFEKCSQPGGAHYTLLPFAIIGITFYCIAYPCVVFTMLYKNRFLIMEDQLLRAEDRGTTRLENPNAYLVRKMYSKCVACLCSGCSCALDFLCYLGARERLPKSVGACLNTGCTTTSGPTTGSGFVLSSGGSC